MSNMVISLSGSILLITFQPLGLDHHILAVCNGALVQSSSMLIVRYIQYQKLPSVRNSLIRRLAREVFCHHSPCLEHCLFQEQDLQCTFWMLKDYCFPVSKQLLQHLVLKMEMVPQSHFQADLAIWKQQCLALTSEKLDSCSCFLLPSDSALHHPAQKNPSKFSFQLKSR
jgi:hypothetical protein